MYYVSRRPLDGKFFWADGGGQATAWVKSAHDAYIAGSIKEMSEVNEEMGLDRYDAEIVELSYSIGNVVAA